MAPLPAAAPVLPFPIADLLLLLVLAHEAISSPSSHSAD